MDTSQTAPYAAEMIGGDLGPDDGDGDFPWWISWPALTICAIILGAWLWAALFR